MVGLRALPRAPAGSRRHALPLVAGTEAAMSAPLSARDLIDWLRGAEPELNELGITATHAAGAKMASGAASWISFSSRHGSARVVRAEDGSCRSTAHRYADGASVLDTTSPSTTIDDLRAVASAIGEVPPAR